MAHVVLIGEEAQCAPYRNRLLGWGLTVAQSGPGIATDACLGVDACDVVLMIVDPSAVPEMDAVTDGGRGAVPAAPRLFLPEMESTAAAPGDLWPRLQEACRQARGLRSQLVAPEFESPEDVQQVGHELRSPLTVIKTALEAMESDLHNWHDEPADIETQLKMLQIALRNVRRLHRAVEWSQMLLAGPRSEPEPTMIAAGGGALSSPFTVAETDLAAGRSRAG